MRITCWGARGSVPVSGTQYVEYGGDTSCLEVRGRDDRLIIVDAGTGIRRLGNQVLTEGPVEATILFTHVHWDHISGIPFFKPLYKETTRLSVVCRAFRPKFVAKMLEHPMVTPFFPVPLNKVQAKIDYPVFGPGPFKLGKLAVDSIPVSHPNGGVGYKFTDGNRSLVFITDNELGYDHAGARKIEEYRQFCLGVDLLIHDAEYTPDEYEKVRGYGHSTYTEALDLALTAGVKKLALWHHNQDRSDDQITEIVADCRKRVKKADSRLEVLAMSTDLTLKI